MTPSPARLSIAPWLDCAPSGAPFYSTSVFRDGQSVQNNQFAMPQVSLMRLQRMGLANKMTLSYRLLVGFESSPLSISKSIPPLI